MIDARRMEVYTASFDSKCKYVQHECAVVLSKEYFENLDSSRKHLFFGNGSSKAKGVCIQVMIT